MDRNCCEILWSNINLIKGFLKRKLMCTSTFYTSLQDHTDSFKNVLSAPFVSLKKKCHYFKKGLYTNI